MSEEPSEKRKGVEVDKKLQPVWDLPTQESIYFPVQPLVDHSTKQRLAKNQLVLDSWFETTDKKVVS